jgi:hypothetical protein
MSVEPIVIGMLVIVTILSIVAIIIASTKTSKNTISLPIDPLIPPNVIPDNPDDPGGTGNSPRTYIQYNNAKIPSVTKSNNSTTDIIDYLEYSKFPDVPENDPNVDMVNGIWTVPADGFYNISMSSSVLVKITGGGIPLPTLAVQLVRNGLTGLSKSEFSWIVSDLQIFPVYTSFYGFFKTNETVKARLLVGATPKTWTVLADTGMFQVIGY